MSQEDDQLLAKIAAVSAEIRAADKKTKALKDRQLQLFLRARKRKITTPALATASTIPVGTVRQILNRAPKDT